MAAVLTSTSFNGVGFTDDLSKVKKNAEVVAYHEGDKLWCEYGCLSLPPAAAASGAVIRPGAFRRLALSGRKFSDVTPR